MSKELPEKIDAQTKAIVADRELDYRNRVADGIAEAALGALFHRDNEAGLTGMQTQSFHAFSMDGKAFNPAEDTDSDHPGFVTNLRTQVKDQVREATRFMTESDRQKYAMLLPELVKTLVSDRRYVDGIYEKDLPNIFKIAQDWFENPDAIDQTHFRQGVGGEEHLIARAPAYMVAPLETMERVKKTFTVHGNWAIHHELIDTLNASGDAANTWMQQRIQASGEKPQRKVLREDDHEDEFDENGRIISDYMYVDAAKGEYVNDYIVQKIQAVVGDQFYGDGNPWTQNEYLQEIQNPKIVSEKLMRSLLTETWTEILGEEPDMEALKQEYHFTDKTPTLVLFNAAYAAIEIDRMDPEQVLASRNATQKLQRAYVQDMHPDLVDAVVFQNDLPWDQHDTETKLGIQYLYDTVVSANGVREQAQQRLHLFGQHHARDNYAELFGIPPADLYGVLHASFFNDRSDVANRVQRPMPLNIMEPVGDTRTTVYFQGPPERTFGVYRKIISEQATSEAYSTWLTSRYAAIRFGYDEHAITITQKAEELLQKSEAKGKPRDWRSCLAQAIKEGITKNTWTIDYAADMQDGFFMDPQNQIGSAKYFFSRFINAEGFVGSAHQRQQWDDMTRQLVIRKPTNENMKKELISIFRTYKINEFYRELLVNYKTKSDEAYQYRKTNAITQMAQQPEAAYLDNARFEAEFSTKAGEVPTYYALKDSADTQVFPQLTTMPSLSEYEEKTAEAREAKSERRLKGTGKAIAATIKDYAKELKIDVLAIDDVQADPEIVQRIADVMRHVDEQERAGRPVADITSDLREEMSHIMQLQSDKLMAESALDEVTVPAVAVVAVNAAGKKALEKVLQDANATLFKAESVQYDYMLLLSDIQSSLSKREGRIVSVEEAEQAYHEFLLKVFPQPEHTDPQTEQVIFTAA